MGLLSGLAHCIRELWFNGYRTLRSWICNNQLKLSRRSIVLFSLLGCNELRLLFSTNTGNLFSLSRR